METSPHGLDLDNLAEDASARRAAIRALRPAITVRTLIVSGTEDRPISTQSAARVHRGIAGARFVAVPETGHAVMIERPDAFNTLLDSFLRKVETG